ncbi:MAG: sodium/proton-translocating pyrophosphatase, partial [Chloroflexi bacterium]|nr:sodium/proton-translocating pyrophosphatase [Chloroflexota bacterium]
MDLVWIATISGIIGLGFAGFLAYFVLRQDEGTEQVKQISAAIKEGAITFLNREYRILGIFVIVIAIVLGVIPNLGWWASLAFVFGAICSAVAGYVGMNIAVRANGRTATAAQKSLNEGLKVAFRGGGVMGMCVVGIGLVGLTILYFAFHNHPDFIKILPAFGAGASGVAIFARAGGGIYTKAADTGADLVGKVEKGIPEDDPRNAAVIADFVGDNVGDVAGMGADLFESYVDSIIATITLAAVAIAAGIVGNETTAWYLPLMVAAGGIIASIIGTFAVRVGNKPQMEALLGALRYGTIAASILTA